MKQNIIDILPVSKNAKVKRIYSSLKLEKNISFKRFNNKIDLVQVGRIHPGKGQFDAIKACDILFKNGFDFNLKFLGNIQDKIYFEKMNNYLETLEYKSKIEFVGYTSEIKKYLQESDVFIFPSLGEGMSNAIIESLGFGLIPIIYNDTSSHEFKDLGFHIHLTEENQIENIQNKLMFIAKNLKQEKEKSSLNINLAQNIFSPNREKYEYLNLLN